eukprot:maker-scaffold_6-snap-gene-3.47-mRNA-1 protein AED:0.15 eAED:0.15 QI:107/1/1/1/0/0.5/2/67/786
MSSESVEVKEIKALTVKSMVEGSKYLESFRELLIKRKASENLLFIFEANEYKEFCKDKGPDDYEVVRQSAIKIAEKFLPEEAEYAVNMGDIMKRPICDTLDWTDPSSKGGFYTDSPFQFSLGLSFADYEYEEESPQEKFFALVEVFDEAIVMFNTELAKNFLWVFQDQELRAYWARELTLVQTWHFTGLSSIFKVSEHTQYSLNHFNVVSTYLHERKNLFQSLQPFMKQAQRTVAQYISGFESIKGKRVPRVELMDLMQTKLPACGWFCAVVNGMENTMKIFLQEHAKLIDETISKLMEFKVNEEQTVRSEFQNIKLKDGTVIEHFSRAVEKKDIEEMYNWQQIVESTQNRIKSLEDEILLLRKNGFRDVAFEEGKRGEINQLHIKKMHFYTKLSAKEDSLRRNLTFHFQQLETWEFQRQQSVLEALAGIKFADHTFYERVQKFLKTILGQFTMSTIKNNIEKFLVAEDMDVEPLIGLVDLQPETIEPFFDMVAVFKHVCFEYFGNLAAVFANIIIRYKKHLLKSVEAANVIKLNEVNHFLNLRLQNLSELSRYPNAHLKNLFETAVVRIFSQRVVADKFPEELLGGWDEAESSLVQNLLNDLDKCQKAFEQLPIYADISESVSNYKRMYKSYMRKWKARNGVRRVKQTTQTIFALSEKQKSSRLTEEEQIKLLAAREAMEEHKVVYTDAFTQHQQLVEHKRKILEKLFKPFEFCIKGVEGILQSQIENLDVLMDLNKKFKTDLNILESTQEVGEKVISKDTASLKMALTFAAFDQYNLYEVPYYE